MSDELRELFEIAEQALHPQSLVARQNGMEAIYHIEERIGLGLAPPEESWNDIPDGVKQDIVHDTGLPRIFIELQREADKRGLDVDYGLGGSSDSVVIDTETARVAYEELGHVISESDPPEEHGQAMTPLARARKRVKYASENAFTPQLRAGYKGALEAIDNVGEQTGAETAPADPLTDAIFDARRSLGEALGRDD